MSESEIERKRRKKEKKAKKEKKSKKERHSHASSSYRSAGLEEVDEDGIGSGSSSSMGLGLTSHRGAERRRSMDKRRDRFGGDARQIDEIEEEEDDAYSGNSARRAHRSAAHQHIDLDDADGAYDDDDGGFDDLADGMGMAGDGDADRDMMLDELESNGADLDLDYHPPPPKTAQQVAIAGTAFILLGLIELGLFAWVSDAREVWSLVLSGGMLVLIGLLGIRAASSGTIVSATQYRFSIQLYMLVLLLAATLNMIEISHLPCKAPCVEDDPTQCQNPEGVDTTCAHLLVLSFAVAAFGHFFPIFLFCLPCYLGSAIHIDNLQNQVSLKHPAVLSSSPVSADQPKANYRDADERKY